ncbi:MULTISPECIES: peptide-methionine (R)-S-oxide reductase MsrB [Bartonella]|uniref:Peptide methionine sulfoxide reductase MsrB n=1 Tax=Bartonella choladocola TaxID=2750995 RepID=A0A1U9MGP2_9HYPH|nr:MULTISPECIES: peptide-methionine (R)-S-oxide reductase MsrB [Bartonella]AQT46879.1 peptide-methionine (R)-S-oxide reductase [Bartonella choladocola]MBH9974111.1 peptide-methionine (R)-S-oxide reductase MsrB [Bartonella choladocola]MBI0013718.1 peptide-methionine (R)-S-oxide reductase MsrB [Bartonella sp. B10834G3]
MSDKHQFKITKTDEEWRKQLTPKQYDITRKQGTERAFSGPEFDTSKPGTFYCVCCGKPLYRSETKYESGSGWPSFFRPIDPDAVVFQEDYSHGMERTEVLCADCGSHLGHVFPDGPEPTGLRYCMNGYALTYQQDKTTK